MKEKCDGFVKVDRTFDLEMLMTSGCDRALWDNESVCGVVPPKMLVEDLYGTIY